MKSFNFLFFGIDPSLICFRAHILVTTLSWKAKVDRKLDLFIIQRKTRMDLSESLTTQYLVHLFESITNNQHMQHFFYVYKTRDFTHLSIGRAQNLRMWLLWLLLIGMHRYNNYSESYKFQESAKRKGLLIKTKRTWLYTYRYDFKQTSIKKKSLYFLVHCYSCFFLC